MEPHISYTVIQDLLNRHGISDVTFLDSSYVIAGNEDLPNYGISHSAFLKFGQVLDELITEFHIKYEPQVFDCDDYAMLAHVSGSIAGLNSVGIALGRLYYQNQLEGYHAFNVLPYALSRDPESIILLVIEPQLYPYGGITLANGNKANMLGYEYVIDEVMV